MSHFSVIVIGENVDAQLAPYHEFECTGVVDQYVQSIDQTEEARTEYATEAREETFLTFCEDYYGHPRIESGETPDLKGAHRTGWIEVSGGEVVKVIKRTNPNARWDYWRVGGRWSGYFPLKTGATADVCRWGDVDLEGARQSAEAKARAAFAQWMRVFVVHGRPLSWAACRTAHPKDGAKARTLYNGQKAIIAYQEHDRFGYDCPVEAMGFDEEEYVRLERKCALVPFAVVKDGKWYERGKVGWFACVSGEMDKEEWIDQAAQLFDGLPPDTVVAVVDCHI